MSVNEFLERCWMNKLELRVVADVPWHVMITAGPIDKVNKAMDILRHNQDLEADVIIGLAKRAEFLADLIAERQAIRAADGLPADAHSAVIANMTLGYDFDALFEDPELLI